jgi:hypothetical protein
MWEGVWSYLTCLYTHYLFALLALLAAIGLVLRLPRANPWLRLLLALLGSIVVTLIAWILFCRTPSPLPPTIADHTSVNAPSAGR